MRRISEIACVSGLFGVKTRLRESRGQGKPCPYETACQLEFSLVCEGDEALEGENVYLVGVF